MFSGENSVYKKWAESWEAEQHCVGGGTCPFCFCFTSRRRAGLLCLHAYTFRGAIVPQKKNSRPKFVCAFRLRG
jgi:hypothetical protein